MHASLRDMAQLTLTSTAEVTDLVAYRDGWPDEPRPSYTDLVARAAALALRRHPMLNATIEGDHIRLLPEIHIGLATAVEEGLLVPVVRNADEKSVHQIAAESARLVERVRSGEFGVDQVSGGTFTVTSLGGQGIDAFTPIINPPEVAILGIGRIVEQPVRDGDHLVWRKVMTLSLTIDHRVVDGSPGAAFLATVVALLGDPSQLESQGRRG
jgi:pyruvate dehydrogenase E2 component (dihydrolipoamide acetyltransferase)